MALYENRITLRDYLGEDAENLATSHRCTYKALSLATKSSYKDKQTNERVNHTEWHRIVAFGKPADHAKYLKKDDYLEIAGEPCSTELNVEVGQGKKKTPVKHRGWEIRASVVKKLAQPESERGGNLDAKPITRTTPRKWRCSVLSTASSEALFSAKIPNLPTAFFACTADGSEDSKRGLYDLFAPGLLRPRFVLTNVGD